MGGAVRPWSACDVHPSWAYASVVYGRCGAVRPRDDEIPDSRARALAIARSRARGVDRCATSIDFEFDRGVVSMDGARGRDRDRGRRRRGFD